MAQDTTVRCSFGSKSVVFAICGDSTYENLCYLIRSKFIGLASSTFQIKYAMLGMDYCALCNNEDMNFMFDIMVTSTRVTSYDPDIEIPVAKPEVEPLLEFEA